MPTISPRVLCSHRGAVGKQGSRSSIDWCNGLVAYASQKSIVIVSERSLDVVQTLDDHPQLVTAVRFSHSSVTRPTVAQGDLQLASGDLSGFIYIWHVSEGTILTNMHDIQLAVDQLEWHPEQEDILLSYHVVPSTMNGNGILVLWNTKDGAQLWSRPVHDCSPALSLQFSPFDPSMLVFATTNGSLFVVNDFDTTPLPQIEGKSGPVLGPRIDAKFHVNGQTQPQQSSGQQAASRSSQAGNTNVLKFFALSPHLRNLCFVLMSREIVAFDISIGKGVGSTRLDKVHTAFHSMSTVADDPNYIVCSHVDSAVSVWKRRNGSSFCFDICAIAEVPHTQRLGGKKECTCSLAVSPTDSRRIALVSPEGMFWMWDFVDTFKPVMDAQDRANADAFMMPSIHPNVKPRTGILSAVGQTESIGEAFCMAVRPNDECSANVVAIGTVDGFVQIVEVDKRAVSRTVQLALMGNYPVKDVAWIDQKHLVVCSVVTHPQTKTTPQLYESNIYILDIDSCALRDLRVGRKADCAVRCIRVSPRRQYLAFSVGRTLEFWNLTTLSLIKVVNMDGIVTSICWLPMKNYVTTPETTDGTVERSDSDLLFSEQLLVSTMADGMTSILSSPRNSQSSNNLKCCIVDNKSIRITDTEIDLGTNILSLASQGPFIVAGDTTGTITCWNAGSSSNSSYPTHKGGIFQMELCVATSAVPGYLLFVLFQNRDAVIWDLSRGRLVASSKYIASHGLKILSIGWIDDTPIVLTDDHCLRIYDNSLEQSSGRMSDRFIAPATASSASEPNGPMLEVRNPEPIIETPALLLHMTQMTLQSLLLNMGLPTFTADHRAQLVSFIGEEQVASFEKLKGNTIDLALAVAKFFAFAPSVRFWTLFKDAAKNHPRQLQDGPQTVVDLVEHQLKQRSPSAFSSSAASLPKSPSAAAEIADVTTSDQEKTEARRKNGRELFLSNFAMPSESHSLESELLDVHIKSLGTSTNISLRQHLSAESVLIGRKEEAVDILMNNSNPSADKMDYESALMACVVAASMDRANFVATTKMVAGQLIAQGRLQEGVQLLCLIGKAADACKFMISEGKWPEAAWLANIALEAQERDNIMVQWAGFLDSEGFQGRALEVALGMWDIHRVLDMLARGRSWEHAALVLRALNEMGYELGFKPTAEEKQNEKSDTLAPPSSTEGKDGTGPIHRRGSVVLKPIESLCNLINQNYKEHLSGVLHLHDLL